jgi:hypothetical protein
MKTNPLALVLTIFLEAIHILGVDFCNMVLPFFRKVYKFVSLQGWRRVLYKTQNSSFGAINNAITRQISTCISTLSVLTLYSYMLFDSQCIGRNFDRVKERRYEMKSKCTHMKYIYICMYSFQ